MLNVVGTLVGKESKGKQIWSKVANQDSPGKLRCGCRFLSILLPVAKKCLTPDYR